MTDRLALTAEDMADLIAGNTINVPLESGPEIIVSAPDGVNRDWPPTETETEARYRWHGWAEEIDNENDDDRKDVFYLTITDSGEEMAVIMHRVCRQPDGLVKYPLTGALALGKIERADRIVAALNAQEEAT